ncbi:transposase domain-containing protein [Acidovorax sp. LjRoot117]|uniref:transposase domain-containing protein n=1 Tax=Acidovorax sp. LjRoot117 TaxID=3342255 RepID=UPI003F5033ED
MRAGKRAAAVISIIQSAKLNGMEPWAYLKDVLIKLPTQPALRIAELLRHRRGIPHGELQTGQPCRMGSITRLYSLKNQFHTDHPTV